MSGYRLGHNKESEPVTFAPDGSYIFTHVTGACLNILNEQNEEIQALKKVILDVSKEIRETPELNMRI